MFISEKDVGLATFRSPGVYDVHWYYQKARGREAIKLGKAMCGLLFKEHGAQILRGFVKKHLKASRWACRQVGFKSMGFLTFADGDENEVFYLSKADYEKDK